MFPMSDSHHPRPTIDNSPSILPSDSIAVSPTLAAPSGGEVAHNHRSSQTTPTPAPPGSNEDTFFPEQKPTPPKWSVTYNPKVDRALDLRLAYAFKYDSPVHCVKISPDGQSFAVGFFGHGKTYLNELQTGSNICVLEDRSVEDFVGIRTIEFSPNGQLLATGATDNHIRIWDITIKRMRAILKGHTNAINRLAFSPNGRSLASAADDQSARIWNIFDGSSKVLPLTESAASFLAVAFSPDGRYIAAGDLNGTLYIWDSRTLRLVVKCWGYTSNVVWCAEFTSDGKGLMTGDSENTVKCWDVSFLANRQRVSTAVVNEESFPLARSFLGHDDYVCSVALFPENSRWMVSGSADISVRVWDTENGVCQLTLRGHTELVRRVDASRDFLATSSHDGNVTVWKYEQVSPRSESDT